MTEDYIIRNCAPTLAGLKTGSMFTCPYQCRQSLYAQVRGLNQRLRGKGLRMLPLRCSQDRALIYLYRPGRLDTDLSQATAAELLFRQGYSAHSSHGCVLQLMRKLNSLEDFPHEIGLFLGYPPEDVKGFMECGGRCCKCAGCWKVYGDEAAARKKFAQYKKCTRVYCDQWARGKTIERLTVAS